MAGFIARQPNGKICRFSTVVDTVTDWNMTEEEYIEMCAQEAAEMARDKAKETLKKHIQSFNEVKKSFCPGNHSVEEFNEILKQMGETELLDPKEYDFKNDDEPEDEESKFYREMRR